MVIFVPSTCRPATTLDLVGPCPIDLDHSGSFTNASMIGAVLLRAGEDVDVADRLARRRRLPQSSARITPGTAHSFEQGQADRLGLIDPHPVADLAKKGDPSSISGWVLAPKPLSLATSPRSHAA